MDNISLLNTELLIFDLDGVIYVGNEPIATALEAINRYYNLNKKIAFFTNNSTLTRKSYVKKLTKLGISCTVDQIYTSSFISAEALIKTYTNPSAYVVGEEGLIKTLEEYTITVLNDKYDFDEIINNSKITCNFVIAGLDRTLTYKKLAAGTQLINRGADFYATNDDSTLPNEAGFLPGAGVIVNAISVATDKKPLNTFGKPSPAGIIQILEDFNVPPEKAIMVGDRPETDILSAKRAGIRSALVLTGTTGIKDIDAIKKDLQPDLILTDLSEF